MMRPLCLSSGLLRLSAVIYGQLQASEGPARLSVKRVEILYGMTLTQHQRPFAQGSWQLYNHAYKPELTRAASAEHSSRVFKVQDYCAAEQVLQQSATLHLRSQTSSTSAALAAATMLE